MEQYLAQTRNEYFSAIERSLGTGFSSTYNAMPFIEFFVAALRAHSDHLTQRLTQWHRDMEQVQAAAGAMNLNHRQADALAYAMKTGKLTRAGYLEITRTSPITASRDLADLVARGWLEPVGRTRGRFYRLLGPAQGPPAPPFSSRPPAT